MRSPFDEEDDEQLEFERAALDALRGYLQTLDSLRDSLEREAKLKRQVAALIGLDDNP